MTEPFEVTEPYDEGMLAVGDGHSIHWSVAGNPDGKPAVLLHGGPGSGSSPSHRRMFDPTRYRIVQFDQRNCGRSTPYAGEPTVDLSANTTRHLIADIEQLRVALDIDQWMVWGGSWGSTLGLAYAQAHPEAVTELMLTAVCSTNSVDVAWTTRVMGRVLPRPWQAFRDHLPPDRRDANLALAYNELVMNPDPEIHRPAAAAWCRWEDHHMSIAGEFRPGLVDADPSFQLCFARLVTHYWANAAFMDDDQLLRNAHTLNGIPTFLAHGRLDISSPLDFPVAVADAIAESRDDAVVEGAAAGGVAGPGGGGAAGSGGGVELLIADDGHGGSNMTQWAVSITNRLVAI